MPRRPARQHPGPSPGGGALAAMAVLVGLASPASAAPVVVADPQGASDEGQATALLLRSLLDDGHGSVVARAEVQRRGGGAAGTVLLERLHAGFLLSIEVGRGDDGLAAWYRLDGADGRHTDGRVEAAPGDVQALAVRIARAVAPRLGRGPREDALGPASLAELRPYARAAAALARGDRAAAVASLGLADAEVARGLGGARDLAAALFADAGLPLGARLRAGRLAGDAPAALALAIGSLARDPLARAEKVRLLIAAGELDAAAAELAHLPGSVSPELAIARAELVKRRGGADAPRAIALLLRPWLERRKPEPTALAFAARLPPRFLDARAEAALLEAAGRAAPAYPDVAALVAVRAARGGTLSSAAAALVRVEDLAGADLMSVDRNARTVEGSGTLLSARIAARRAIAERIEHVSSSGGASPSVAPQTRAGAALLAAGPMRLPGEPVRATPRMLPADGDAASARGAATRVPLELPRDRSAVDPAPTATAVALPDRAPAAAGRSLSPEVADADTSQAAAALAPMLAAFPELLDRHPTNVLIAEQTSRWSAFGRTHEILRPRLEGGLRHALASSPYHLSSTPVEGPAIESLTTAELRDRVARVDPSSEAVLVWKADTDGSHAIVQLTLFDVAQGSALAHTADIDGSAGLTRWNRTLLGWLGALALLAGCLALYLFVLTGEVDVDVVPDAGIDRHTLAVRLSRRARRPTIDAASFERRYGNRRIVGRRVHIGADRKVRFRWVAPGGWWVHVYGVVVRGGQVRALGDDYSRQTTVHGGRTAFVSIDLKVNVAEYQVLVMDGTPRADTAVWVDELREQAVYTSAEGLTTVRVQLGSHVIRADAGDIIAEKRINVTSSRAVRVTIDAAFERRIARIVIADEDPVPAPPLGRSGMRAAATLGAPEALAHAGWPGGGLPGVDLPLAPVGTADGGAPLRAETLASRLADVGQARRLPTVLEQVRGEVAGAPDAGVPRAPAKAFGGGRYRVVTRLGSGAMGVVYRVRDTVLDRDVALKVVGDEGRRHGGVLQMFLQEAKAMASLNHPNLVTVFDQGQDGAEAFMVMELIDGDSLAQILEMRGRLPWREVVSLSDQLCAGLAYAHEHRILHRDIKPANIFVSRREVVKIGDFGLARAVERLRVTRTKICGSPAYMAPEQIRGSDLDFRSDLYALGCTLFEMLTGRVPFIEGEPMYHHMYTPPPDPMSLEPSVPAAIAQVVLACLVKDKDARMPSASALRQQMRAAAEAAAGAA